MVAAIEHRFGRVSRSPVTYRMPLPTTAAASLLAMPEASLATSVLNRERRLSFESPPSIGMAEAFIRTMKRDYVRVSFCQDAETLMLQLNICGFTQPRIIPTAAHSNSPGIPEQPGC